MHLKQVRKDAGELIKTSGFLGRLLGREPEDPVPGMYALEGLGLNKYIIPEDFSNIEYMPEGYENLGFLPDDRLPLPLQLKFMEDHFPAKEDYERRLEEALEDDELRDIALKLLLEPSYVSPQPFSPEMQELAGPGYFEFISKDPEDEKTIDRIGPRPLIARFDPEGRLTIE